MLSLQGKKVAVLGLMDAGIAAIRAVHKLGGKPAGYGVATENDLQHAREQLKGIKVDLFADDPPADFLKAFDLIVTTPGAKRYQAQIDRFREEGGQVFSDLELACHFFQKPLIAITGTNGKSTVMWMVKELFASAGKKVLQVGGDYTDFGDAILSKEPYDYIATELSSARLATTQHFRPYIALFLNLYPGHAERHRSMEDYGDAKAKICAEQDAGDFLIYQKSPDVEGAIQRAGCRSQPIPMAMNQAVTPGIYYDFKENVVHYSDATANSRFPLDRFPLAGLHKVENLMAALAVAKLCGVTDAVLQQSLESFKEMPHRMELVKKLDGVAFFNDAKSANVMATYFSLQSLPDQKTILIAGGEYMSQQFYKTLVPLMQKKLKCLIIFGAYRERFYKHWGEVGETFLVETLEEAVELAARSAEKGDCVLFSPASRPERHVHMSAPRRGEAFKKAVQGWVEVSKARRFMPPRA